MNSESIKTIVKMSIQYTSIYHKSDLFKTKMRITINDKLKSSSFIDFNTIIDLSAGH